MNIDTNICAVVLEYPDGRVTEFGPGTLPNCRIECEALGTPGKIVVNGEAIPVMLKAVEAERPDTSSEFHVVKVRILLP